MNPDRMRSGRLEGPLVIVGLGDSILLLVKQGDEDNVNADAMMYELDQGAFFDEIKPLPLWLKFMYDVDVIEPAIPFTEEERLYRLETYRAKVKAREAANANED